MTIGMTLIHIQSSSCINSMFYILQEEDVLPKRGCLRLAHFKYPTLGTYASETKKGGRENIHVDNE